MKTPPRSAAACRWTARIVSAFALVVIVIIAVGEGMPVGHLVVNLCTHPLTLESVGFVGLIVMVAGMIAGWRWEVVGGLSSLAGVALIYVPTSVNGRITWFLAVLALPGALYVTSHFLRRDISKRTLRQPS